MDTNYSFFGETQDKIPVFRNIVTRNARIEGAGRVTLEGFDAAHRPEMQFDNVRFTDPAAIKVQAKNADLVTGPGAFNLPVTGNGVTATANSTGG